MSVVDTISDMKDYQSFLKKTLNGNKNAFNEIVKRFQNMAYNIASKRIPDAGLAQDTVQEAFLKAYLKLSTLRDLSSFPAWFRTILHSCCNRTLKLNAPYKSMLSLDQIAPTSTDAFSPLEICTRCMSRDRVIKFLASLSDINREVCTQRYVYGRSYKDIANDLNVPLGTVKRRLHDARDKIIHEFKKSGQRIISVGYLPISDHLLAMISHHRHDNQNFQIQLHKFLSWPSLVKSLINGIVDAAFIMAPLAMFLRNSGIRIQYVLDGHHDGSAITVRKHITSKNSLAGALMGLPYSVSTHQMILHSLFGSDPFSASRDIRAKYISPSYVIGSLMKQEIDGFFCSEPWGTKSVAEGKGRILVRSKDLYPGHICCVVAAREDFSAKHGDLLFSYLRLLLSAGEYIAEHPAASAKIQARYTGITSDIAEGVLRKGYITYHDLAPDRNRIEASMTLALQAKILDKECDLNSFMSTNYL
ncbi:MAG: NitT/TauT family transport system substrate-binding protein [Desulfobacteraceae bacterium Eth-SRB1]|nr:MAG: NitT/TauT family transport system substrate-binding protein [Desulfobacteraceae bacterium Eth-SRB1]